jgi:hypothetical protein
MGCTGLALLAFLGAGHTHRHGRFRSSVRKAIWAIKSRQTADGCFGKKSKDGRWIYNHAIACYAMAEAYCMAGRLFVLKTVTQKGIDFLVQCQNPGSGWRYGIRPGVSDSSVTAWAVLALKTAKIAGLQVPKSAFDGAMNWFDKMLDRDYFRTGYMNRGDSGGRPGWAISKFQHLPANTAAGVFARILIHGEKARNGLEVRGGANLIKLKLPSWDVLRGSIDMHYWFFGTYAMLFLRDTYWNPWTEALRTALIPSQRRDGCGNGSWDPVGVCGRQAGRVYATAINCMSLEFHYRYRR